MQQIENFAQTKKTPKIECLLIWNNSWCGYRDSNPGPLPWQGSALTTELHPRNSPDQLRPNLDKL
jgi:hypothetical protein